MTAGILIGALATSIILQVDKPADAPAIASQPATVETPAPAESLPATHKPRFDFYTLLKETEVIVPEPDGSPAPRTVVVTATAEPPADAPAASTELAETDGPAQAERPQSTTTSTAATATPPEMVQPPQSAEPQPIATTAAPAPSREAVTAPAPASTQSRDVYVLQAGSFRLASDADSVRARLLLLNLQASVERVTANNETWHRVLIGPFSSQTESSRVRSTLTQNGIESIQLKRQQ